MFIKEQEVKVKIAKHVKITLRDVTCVYYN